ncbi:MAG: hypothetical protein WDM87_01400 [Terracidiphilus sp.]
MQLVQIEKPDLWRVRFWRAWKARQCLCRWALPREQARVRVIEEKRGYATAEVEEIRFRGGRSELRRHAGILERAAAASISMRSTKRSLLTSRRFCARRWSGGGVRAPGRDCRAGG